MNMLAYDPELLASLLVQMRGAVDTARRVRSSDPAAADAMRTLRRAIDAVENTWAPAVRRVLTVDPLAANGVVLRLDEMGVRAFTRSLADVDVDAVLDDPTQMAMLADRLTLLTQRPALLRVLSDEMGDGLDEWVTLCNELALTHHAFLYDSPTAEVIAARERLVASLAVVVGSDLGRLNLLQPFAAALLVPHLHLHGAELAEVADGIVLRWCDDPWAYSAMDVTADERDVSDPYPADVLFPLLLADAEATQRYAELAATHPRTLLQATTQPELMHRVVLTATHPARVDAEGAGALLLPLLAEYAAGDSPLEHTALADPHWPEFLADALAPWLLHLSPLDTAWGLNADDRRRYLNLLVTHDDALARLVHHADALRAAQNRELSEVGTIDQSRFAALMGMISELTIRRRYDDEREREAAYTLIVGLIVTAATIPMSTGAGLATGAGAGAISDLAGFDPSRAADDEAYAQAYNRVVIGAVSAHALYGHWAREGTLPAGVPPPPLPHPAARFPMRDYFTRFQGWLHTLPGGATGERGLQMVVLVDPWINAVDVGEENAFG